MGQYHKLVSLDARQWINPYTLGNGLKMIEQAGSTVPAALLATLAVDPGDAPADLKASPIVGIWAGHRLGFFGDYAEPFDIPGLTPSADLIYELCGDEFTDVSQVAVGTIEAAMSIRYIAGSTWAEFVSVKFADHSYILVGSPEDMKYYAKAGFVAGLGKWNRPPAEMEQSVITDANVDQGQKRVIANLETREYIDPVAFGLSGTTAGMMREPWSVGTAVALALFHPNPRGGGDLAFNTYTGRWRNHPLIATAEHAGKFPSTKEVMDSFTDISTEAVAAVALAKKDW